ncbi:MAG: DUF4114 domain-containing protein, partial [Paracoccaceae bacterium]
DTGSTGGESDGSSNGSGAGETAAAGHHHYVTLGKGAHTVSGDLSALDGTVYKRFGTDDSITLTGAATAQSHITVKKRRAVVDVDLDNDGTPDGTIVLKGKFKHGDFLATHSNGDMVVTYHDAIKFRNGRPLDVDEVGGIVNQAYLNGDNAHSFQVTLGTRAKTGYRDTVGAYEVDANGNIVDVRILTANAKADAGNSFIVDNVESGHDLGFFLVQNGGRTLDSSTLSSGNLSFVQLSDGTMALADNGVVIGNAHTFLSHDPALNFDGAQHVVSGADRDGGMMIGFEDTDYLSGHHPDDDFQDVLLNVEALYGFGS